MRSPAIGAMEPAPLFQLVDAMSLDTDARLLPDSLLDLKLPAAAPRQRGLQERQPEDFELMERGPAWPKCRLTGKDCPYP